MQFGGLNDIIASQNPIQGVDENVAYPKDKNSGSIDEHLIENYNWIFNKEQNGKGSVLPLKDAEIK